MNKQDKTIKDLKERNDKLSNQCLLSQVRENATQRKNKELQQRIDKAIEYIEKLKNFKIEYVMLEEKELYASEKDFVNDLLDILRGNDDE